MDSVKEACDRIEGVSFKVYTSQEIRKLSVLEVTNIRTFDALGHPVLGGLCDNVFGPASRDDICRTCHLDQNECSGHFGHISLALPVFNPVFVRHLYQLVRMSCFKCNRLLLSPVGVKVFLAQLEALDYGLDYMVDELAEYSMELVKGEKQAVLDLIQLGDYVASRLKDKLKAEYKRLGSLESKKNSQVRNVVARREKMIKDFFQGKLCAPSKVCHYCAAKKTGMTIVNNSLIIVNMSKKAVNEMRKQHKEGNVDEDEDEEAEESVAEPLAASVKEAAGKSYLTPLEAKNILRSLWKHEKSALRRICGLLSGEEVEGGCPIDVFFLEVIPVPPNRFRPMRFLAGRSFENEHTSLLNQVMMASLSLEGILDEIKESREKATTSVSSGDNGAVAAKLHFAWQRLQILCNRIYDSEMDKLPEKKIPGIRQVIEKKDGLFRKHMMGKRVNFAARSVISPDPYIMADEVGIPLVFAVKLTYPQPVNHWNLKQLQEAILNGPDVHPGASSVQFEDGYVVRLKPGDPNQRELIAKKITAGSLRNDAAIRIVNRHLITGDVLVLNRQPTLHKPSIMGHKARVLPNEKTLRLHYANCKCYNADFDGDEMNAHFPQSELARAEAYEIASVNKNYLVPKDGTPLSGLIQDHIVAGALLTMRGMFFNKSDYQELVYGALYFLNKTIKLMPPAMRKPLTLWSGKQIFSTVILNLIPDNRPPPTVYIPSKVKSKTFISESAREWTAGGSRLSETEMCESQVVIKAGELLQGIMCKSNMGPTAYGLIHCCYELYGGQTSSALMTSFARLSTNYLQIHSGLTLGIHDILVRQEANEKRKEIIRKSLEVGDKAATTALSITDSIDKEMLTERLREAHVHPDPIFMKQLDNSMKCETDRVNNDISEACLGKGLVKRFPDNNLQMMIEAGAKGGTVNALQISCLLGQIELEGRRVPLMMSGRSLSSFEPYDTSPRAGGFVTGRFLTGIQPQEFFFHCMAGREGLIDTAVKTSRSGYLQRCLIKHLEGLVVNYDMTVRDSDGSVIQFQYGEDGQDILKNQYLNEQTIPALILNHKAVAPKDEELGKLRQHTDVASIDVHRRDIADWEENGGANRLKHKRGSAFLDYFARQYREYEKKCADESTEVDQNYSSVICDSWFELDKKERKKLNTYWLPCPDPVATVFSPDASFGVFSERFDGIIKNYIAKNPHHLLKASGSKDNDKRLSVENFLDMMSTRYMKSLCEPGEAVGLLAAQSVGEPSTQMTLNTFHFAGRGEMNVTLGIPRLREILMTASAKIATPNMDIPFLLREESTDEDMEELAEKVRLSLNGVKLSDVLEDVEIKETLSINTSGCHRIYDLHFRFIRRKYYKRKFNVNPNRILAFMENKFVKILLESIKRKMKAQSKSNALYDHSTRGPRGVKAKEGLEPEDAEDQEGAETKSKNKEKEDKPLADDEEGGSSDEEANAGEDDTTDAKSKSRRDQDLGYEDPEEEEIELDADEESVDNDAEARTCMKSSDETDRDGEGDGEGEEEEQEKDSRLELADLKREKKKKESKKKAHQQLEAQRLDRQNQVRNLSPFITNYDFDTSDQKWCSLSLRFELNGSKLDMASLVEEEAKSAYIYKVGNINRAFLVKDSGASKKGVSFDQMIKTEGVSFLTMVKFNDVLDLNRMYSNDIHAIANTYGIEAAAKAIRREITNVFAVYGIQVNSRHLSLIADYMTFDGSIKGMNRISMASNSSSIQQMTFETTTNFLKSAALMGTPDNLNSPSARIFVGRAPAGGTGILSLLQNPDMNKSVTTPASTSYSTQMSRKKASPWRGSSFGNSRKRVSYQSSIPQTLNKKIKFSE